MIKEWIPNQIIMWPLWPYYCNSLAKISVRIDFVYREKRDGCVVYSELSKILYLITLMIETADNDGKKQEISFFPA